MAQSNKSASEDLSDVCYKQKWDNIFNGSDLYFDEELDYEYSDAEDAANCFPMRYTWSPDSSSQSSSRAASPIGRVINLIDEEKEYVERRRALKKLTRDYSELCKIKRKSFTSYLRKDWKNTMDFKGMLKRWRIRSLDVIFAFKNRLQVPECSGNLQFPSKKHKMRKPLHLIQTRTTEEDTLSNLSIVINNDLCTSAVPEVLPPSDFLTEEEGFSINLLREVESGEQDLGIDGNKPSCDTKSSFSMLMPPGLDMPLLNVPSNSQMIGSNELTQFLDANNVEACNELAHDTFVRTVLQQPSQQQDYHPVRPSSTNSFSQFSRYDEPYNRPASTGSQHNERGHVSSYTNEAIEGQRSNFGDSEYSSTDDSFNGMF